MGDLYRYRMQLVVYPDHRNMGAHMLPDRLLCNKTAPCETIARRLAVEQAVCMGLWVDHFSEVRKCNLN